MILCWLGFLTFDPGRENQRPAWLVKTAGNDTPDMKATKRTNRGSPFQSGRDERSRFEAPPSKMAVTWIGHASGAFAVRSVAPAEHDPGDITNSLSLSFNSLQLEKCGIFHGDLA